MISATIMAAPKRAPTKIPTRTPVDIECSSWSPSGLLVLVELDAGALVLWEVDVETDVETDVATVEDGGLVGFYDSLLVSSQHV